MNTELLLSIEETKRHLQRLKKKLEEAEKAEKVEGLWKPEAGRNYYFVDVAGDTEFYRWEGDMYDNALATNHNVFPKPCVARKAGKLMRRSNLVISACLQVDPDFEPDWDNRDQTKWFPRYDHNVEAWYITTCYRVQADVVCVSSREKGQEALAILNAQDE